jgi:DNA-binding NarL/FixJ family response regulator
MSMENKGENGRPPFDGAVSAGGPRIELDAPLAASMVEAAGNTKVKVLIADNYPALRGGIRHAITAHPNFIAVGEAATGASTIEHVKRLMPDLVVMDIHLPDMDGLEAARQILAAHPAIKIIIFSGDPARSIVDRALQAGVCGYVSKCCPVEELMLAMATVMEDKLYLSREVSANILEEYRRSLAAELRPPKPALRDRQRQVLRLVAEGRRNKEIAVQLSISIKTVEASRSRLMKKLGCSSSAELIRYAVREGIAIP